MNDEDTYRAAPGVSASRLKKMRESPKHYNDPYSGKDTRARMLLRAQHCAILEPERFAAEYTVCSLDRRTKAGKEWAAALPEGVTVLTEEEGWKIDNIRDAVSAHPVAGPLLAKGDGEVGMHWTDPETGLACKGRVDWINTKERYIADVKGYGTSNPRIISQRVESIGAHIQAGHYVSGVEVLMGWTPRYYVISTEQAPPWDVCVVELADVAKMKTPEGVDYEVPGALADGRTERAKLMARVKECTESGEWPGRHEHDVVQLLPPPWRAEEEGEFVFEEDDS